MLTLTHPPPLFHHQVTTMSNRTNRSRSAQPTKRGTRLYCERLEDRWVPHSGVTTFSTGITADSAPTGIVRGPDENLWFA